MQLSEYFQELDLLVLVAITGSLITCMCKNFEREVMLTIMKLNKLTTVYVQCTCKQTKNSVIFNFNMDVTTLFHVALLHNHN